VATEIVALDTGERPERLLQAAPLKAKGGN
jgi:hypothetical protein